MSQHSQHSQRSHKGRGATSNHASRFSTSECIAVDDGWHQEASTSAPKTCLQRVRAKTIITRNQSPDIPFAQSINPYQGCEHGCVYCFARPTHAYWDLSPGLDFETQILYKPNAAKLLEEEISSPRYQCRPIAFGTNTDPYQPAEKTQRIMREVLEVLHRHKHPLGIVTKSTLITRDLDILTDMASRNLVHVMISVTTLDNDLKRKLEPRTASPATRLRTIHELTAGGVPTGVMAAPVIPALNDPELEDILGAAQTAGASSAAYILLRLPLEVGALFEEWLEVHYPDRAKHVMSLVRQCRNGKSYQSGWGSRMRGTGVFADLIERRFQIACNQLGLTLQEGGALDTALFRRQTHNRQGLLF